MVLVDFFLSPLSVSLPLSTSLRLPSSLTLSLPLFLSLSLAPALMFSQPLTPYFNTVRRSLSDHLSTCCEVVDRCIWINYRSLTSGLCIKTEKNFFTNIFFFFCMTDLADLLHALGMYNHDSQEISISMNNRLLLSMSAGLTLLMANILLVHLLYCHIIWKEFCRLTLVMGFRNSLLSSIPLFLSLALSQFLSISLSLSLSLCLALALSHIYLSPLFLLPLFFSFILYYSHPALFRSISLSLLLSLFYSRLISYYIALDFIL